MAENETIDELPVAGLRMLRSPGGYRYALDPFLLCAFSQVRAGEQVVDLGAGTGIIPLLLAATTPAGKIVGVELQPLLAAQARRNVEINRLDGRVAVVEADVRGLTDGVCVETGAYDVVVSNPPYRSVSSGRQAPDPERAATRHELNGGLREFLLASAALLRSKGRLYLVYLAERLPELLAEMRRLQLEPKRMRLVHSRVADGAQLVLVEGRKGGRPGMQVEAPLILYEGDEYTQEARALFGVSDKGGGKPGCDETRS